MTIIKIEPEENGAHANQTAGIRVEIPEGWAEVPQELEASVAEWLPWVSVTVSDGKVTSAEENTAAKEAWETAQAEARAALEAAENENENENEEEAAE